jgi:hypothetical protein
MGRLLGIASVAALAGALLCGVAGASTIAAPTIDLRSQLLLCLFGETTDSGAAQAAAYGDRNGESPLRNLALDAAGVPANVAFVPDAAMPTFAVAIREPGSTDLRLLAAATARSRSMVDEAAFAPTAQPVAPDLGQAGKDAAARLAGAAREQASYTVGTYQPEAPAAVISPEPGSQSFEPLREPAPAGPQANFLATAGSVPGSQSSGVSVAKTLRVGPEQFQGRAGGASLQSQQAALNDNSYGAGANFDVRAGARNVNVDVSSSYEHLLRNDATTFSSSNLGSGTGWQLPGDDVPLAVPNYADMSRLAVGAAVRVPVVKGLTLNLNYDAARLLGGYGLPGVTNLDAIDNSYGGGFTFSIPRLSSTLSVSAHQQHYQDNILPANTATTTQADVNLMVKF